MERFPMRMLSCMAVLILLLVAAPAGAEPLPFQRAVQLALSRASTIQTSAAQVDQAYASYREARNLYLPQLMAGSGLAYTYGFPLSIEGSAPSIFNVNYQSMLYNPAQREFIRSAKVAWQSTQAVAANDRRDVVLDTAVTYIQLDRLQARLKTIREQTEEAGRLLSISSARAQEGVESQIDLTRDRLAEAQARMALADAEGAAAVLRERLSQLTGVSESGIETVTDSIPEVPDASNEQDLTTRAIAASDAVKSAELQARSKELRAKGEHKQSYPAIDAVAQYGLFSRYNNYDQYFQKFQRNNATVGVSIRFPFLNFAQSATADAADAEAVQARHQLETTRNQVASQALQLAQAVRQLSVAEQVGQLQHQLALSDVETVQTQMEAGTPSAAGQPAPSPRDLQLARIQANQRYAELQDTSFELNKARLQLLRALGRLQDWALGKP